MKPKIKRIQVGIVLLCMFSVIAQAASEDKRSTLDDMMKKYSAQTIIRLNVDSEYQFKLKDGSYRLIRLISVEQHQDSVIGKVRRAEVNVTVNGESLCLVCGPYVMPIETNGIRIQADTISGLKRVQFSVWDAKDPIVYTDRFSFPLRDYLLFSHGTQSYNEVVHLGWVDDCPGGPQFYHNYGIDFAGYEGAQEIISCTDGQAIRISSAGNHLFVAIQDDDGFIWEYCHLDSIPTELKTGVRVTKGQTIGVLGKTGPSGNFTHLHLGSYLSEADLDAGRNMSGLNLYPWIVATYEQQYHRGLYAVARPHQTASTGEMILFDGSNSLSFGTKIIWYEWSLPGGEIVNGNTATKAFDKPGVYIATLRIRDEKGHEDVDFCKVRVFTASAPEKEIPTIFMTYTPTNRVVVDQPVLFRLWVQGVKGKSIDIDFGDGTIINDYVSYTEIRHSFTSPGIHIITASGNIDGKPIMQKQKILVSQKPTEGMSNQADAD